MNTKMYLLLFILLFLAIISFLLGIRNKWVWKKRIELIKKIGNLMDHLIRHHFNIYQSFYIHINVFTDFLHSYNHCLLKFWIRDPEKFIKNKDLWNVYKKFESKLKEIHK